MNPSEQPADDFWRKAFDEAAEMPPARVWAAIERQLDGEDSRAGIIIPFWQRAMPWAAGMAAAIALLLIGWWAMQTRNGSQQPRQIAIKNQDATPREPLADLQKETLTKLGNRTTELAKDDNQRVTVLTRDPYSLLQPQVKASNKIKGDRFTVTETGVESPDAATGIDALAVNSVDVTIQPMSSRNGGESVSAFSPALLASRPTNFKQLTIGRIIWISTEAPELSEPTTSQPKGERWASLSVMPASFNPMVALRTATNGALAYTQNSTPVSPSISSNANFSMAYQAGAGMEVSSHWSLETGIAYVQGQSTVESPVQTSLASSLLQGHGVSGSAQNLYADLIRTYAQSGALAGAFFDKTGNLTALAPGQAGALYTADIRQSIANDYQYIQVPMQVGYQLRPRKKLGFALLGGLLANWFVKNTVDNEIVIKPADGLYRPLAWASTVGMRLRYRSTRRWSASLAGLYQQSLQSGTQSDAGLQTHPQSIGMSFGVDYHF